jgi:hypothetical protein
MNEMWLTVAQAAFFERISRMEVYRRMQPGDSHPLIWRDRREVDGQPGRLINPLSMTFAGRECWRTKLLETAESPKAGTGAGQLNLLPRTEVDDQIDALKLPQSECDVILRRYRIVDLCLNCNWKAQGYNSKKDFLKALATRNKTSVRSIHRWTWGYKENGKLEDLAKEIPGPLRGTGAILDLDMRAHLQGCYVIENFTPSQCYRSLINYLQGKQNSPGCRVDHLYPIPSRTTVWRFLDSLDPVSKAAREGPDALKAALGHIDRAYDDLRSLDRVECDEWKYNLFAYDPDRPLRVYRYWLLLFLDIRSIYPLVWQIVRGSDSDTRHGISEEDEIGLTEKLVREYGVPQVLSTDRGRFRGNTWGGQPAGKSRDAQFQRADGILDNLGITYNRPRQSNPRGMRLHPFFLYLSNQCQGLPGYIGRNTVERKTTRGDFEKAEHLEWAAGHRGIKSPLLSLTELSAKTEEWIEWWRDHPSEGTDMRGLSPRAVFVHNTPPEGFRRLSDRELAWHTAERFDVLIGKGGIIQLRDGKRYHDPQLLLLQGQRREVARARHDHEQISVLPAAKGEEAIIAKRRACVGANDPDELARQMELQKRVYKVAGATVKPLEYEPGSQYVDTGSQSKAVQVIRPAEYIAGNHELAPAAEGEIPPLHELEEFSPVMEEFPCKTRAEALPPTPEREIGSVEYLMEHDRYKRRVKTLDFADLEG